MSSVFFVDRRFISHGRVLPARNMDDDVIEARIREINDAVQLLKELTAKGFEELGLYEKFSIRYLVIQAVEAASGICHRILVNVFNERAESFPECFIRLGVKGVIPRDLAERLASAARLGNLLVRRYWDIDDEKVYQSVRQGLRDFRDFISHVRRFQADDPDPEAVDQDLRYYRLSGAEKSEIVERVRELLAPIDKVVFAYLHGSFVEKEFFRDIDVAVWVSDPENAFQYSVNLSVRLEVETGLPVDLQVLNEAPLPFKYRVLTKGKLLLSRDEKLRARIIDEVTRMYLDYKEFLKVSTEK
ncbi:MAG: DUF86 domain-containing protein [Thaumarchaeota archaeon]|nr:DUF86 domain-containing protein [Nitrososphaerota archaeon]